MPGTYCSRETIAVIRSLRKEGLSNREIATRTGRGRRTVDRIVLKLTKGVSTLPKSKSGRPSVVTKRGTRILKRYVLENRRRGSTELQALMQEAGVKVSKPTIRRKLVQLGYRAYIPKKKPFLTKRMKSARLDWAKKHEHWTVNEWKNVVWSDESKFNLFASDGKLLSLKTIYDSFFSIFSYCL
uniref:Transposase Tc1-like domain-containing protein n=1 Tax=Cyprinodon variegatus TaxID=28743 RepID=A0A3Q2G599_CYPVA